MELKYIKLDFLRELCNSDTGRMLQYARLFLQSGPEALERISTYYREGNFEDLRKTVHSFKPQLAYMGLDDMEHLANQIEELAAQKESSEQLGESIERLKTTCQAAFKELEAQCTEWET